MHKVKLMTGTISINTEHFFSTALKELHIDENRKQLLTHIANFVVSELKQNNPVNLNYICTHNSRRSQLSNVWSCYAANYFKLNTVESFSGGTSVTCFYRNTVKTLQQTGFVFKLSEFSHHNPVYSIEYENCNKPIVAFSKLYNNEFNEIPFIAITTCSNADENCPFISEAIQRFHLPFNDPKNFDNTLYTSEKYLEVNKQIAGEIHFIFRSIATAL